MNDGLANMLLQEIRNLIAELGRIRQAIHHLASIEQSKK